MWIVGDVLHSRVARSNILAFTRMGCRVTVCGPPTLIPRGVESLGCEVRYDLDGLEEADVVYALRMQHERMTGSFVPSLREYATQYQINARRLSATQLLMHPGPVNRGVELSAEVIDSPQSLMTDQVQSGRGGAHGRALRAAGRRRPRPPVPRRVGAPPPPSPSPREPRCARRRWTAPRCTPGTVLIRGAHLLDPREGLDGPGDLLVWTGVAELGAPGHARGPRRRRGGGGRGRCTPFPAFVDPHVHLRTPGQEHKEDIETGTRAAAAGGFGAILAMPNTDPVVDNASILQSLRERAAARGAHPHRLHRRCDRRPAGRAPDRDGRPGAAGAPGLTDDGLPVRSAGRDAPGAAVPGLAGLTARAARGGPRAVGRRGDARGRGLGPAGRRRHPLGLGVHDGRARLRPRRLRAGPHPRAARVRAPDGGGPGAAKARGHRR